MRVLADLPPFRRGRPVGTTSRGDAVFLDPSFMRDFFEPLTRQVEVSDGASPGGVDFVAFASYPVQPSSCVAAHYPSAGEPKAALASYPDTNTGPVRASYGAQACGVTFARY